MKRLLLLLLLLLPSPAHAQAQNVEQRLGAQIGSLIISNNVQGVELDRLREQVSTLQKQLDELRPKPKEPTNAKQVPSPAQVDGSGRPQP